MKAGKKSKSPSKLDTHHEFKFSPILYAPATEALRLPPHPSSLKVPGKPGFLIGISKHVIRFFLRAILKILDLSPRPSRGFYDNEEKKRYILERESRAATIKLSARRF